MRCYFNPFNEEEGRNLRKENDLLQEGKSLKSNWPLIKLIQILTDKVINICGSKDAFQNS